MHCEGLLLVMTILGNWETETATLFVYGQTATGKTHTMTGTAASPGLIPQIVGELFAEIRRSEHVERFFPGAAGAAGVTGAEFCLRVSYVEIYNEAVNDLLSPARNLAIHDTPDGRVEVECQELIVKTPAQVLDVLRRGDAARHTGATNMNERSSRSHTIFRLTLESTLTVASTTPSDHPGGGNTLGEGNGTTGTTAMATTEMEPETETSKTAHVAVLTLVDLAGSERLAHTGAEGARRVEAGQINRSLLTLGTVIYKLSEGRAAHVPYRDSKLTRLLQPSLGGNARTGVVCTVSLAPAHCEETLSTLKFAARARRVENAPVINEVRDTATVLSDLKRQIRLLKQQLAQQRSEQSEKELATLSQSIIATPGRPRRPLPPNHQQQQQQQQENEIKIRKMQQLLDYAQTRADDAERAAKEKDHVVARMQGEMAEAVMQYEERIAKLCAQVEALSGSDGGVSHGGGATGATDAASQKRIRELEEQIGDLSDQLEECSRTVETLQAELSQAVFARQAVERRGAELEQRLQEAAERESAHEPAAKRAALERAEAAQEREQLCAQITAARAQAREKEVLIASLLQAQRAAKEARAHEDEAHAASLAAAQQRAEEAAHAQQQHAAALTARLEEALHAQQRAQQDLERTAAQCAALEARLAEQAVVPREIGPEADAMRREHEETVRDYQERVHDLETQRDELMEENIRVRQTKANEIAKLKEGLFLI